MSLRERRLIRRLKERDEGAFRELVETYRDRVYNMTYRMLGNREEAEDVSQEVFITIFKSIDGFRGDAKFSTWLYRVTANHCKNRIKYLARRHDRSKAEFDERISRDQAAGSTAPQAIARPDQELTKAETGALIGKLIAELDEDHRILIVLRDIEELSYEEIGQITELAEGTVKSRLHRARMALRKKVLIHMGDRRG